MPGKITEQIFLGKEAQKDASTKRMKTEFVIAHIYLLWVNSAWLNSLPSAVTGSVDNGCRRCCLLSLLQRLWCSLLQYPYIPTFEIWVWWVGSWLDLLVERAVLSDTKLIGQFLTSDAPQGLMLMPVFFHVYVDDLGSETACAPNKLVNYQTGTASDALKFGGTSTDWRNGVIMMNLMKFDKRN